MQPSISIVVTCYNYGHFLDACLDSLVAQTRRSDEIIVVNDGSLDATRSVLRARSEPLIVLEKENGGQASAFNAGFARATSDIVLFLDADDTLAPDAVETICMAWHDSFAAIGFRLNLIDAAGRFCGFYEVETRDGDMRPELIGWGYFRFMPTSGNAFNRRLLAPVFPLPEPRWRISADTVLLRAAALAGPIRKLQFALGNYRAHGGNSYHRIVLPLPQFMQRALRDMADACLATANLPPSPAIFGPDPDVVRLDLLLASLRQRLKLPNFGDREPQGLRAVRSLRPLLWLRIGLRAKALYACSLALLPPLVRLLPRSRHWIVAPDERPRLLNQVFSWALGSKLANRRRSAHRSRWLEPATEGCFTVHGGHDSVAYFNTLDWRLREPERVRVLCSGTGEIVVPIDYFPTGAMLSLDLKAVGPYVRMPLEIALSKSDQLLGQIRINGEGRLSIVLEPSVTLLNSPLRLKLSAVPRPASLTHRWAALKGPAGLVEVTGLQIEALQEAKTGFMLGLGETRAFTEIAPACQLSPLPDLESDWPELVEAGELVLALIRPALSEPTELVFRFQDDQMNGSLVVADRDGPLYRGQIGPSAVVRVPVASRRFPDDSELVLTLGLDPEDPFAAAAFRLISIGLASPGSTFEAHSSKDFPMIGPGTSWRLDEKQGGALGLLGDGWTRSELGAELFDTLGILRFTVDPATAGDAILRMLVAPAMSLPDDALLAVVITIRDEVVSQVFLQGEYDLAVPLGEVLAKGGRRVELAVHVALKAGGDSDVELGRGGLLLKSVRLSSQTSQFAIPRPPSPHIGHTLSSDIQAAGAHARKLRAKEGSPDPSEIAELVSWHHSVVTGIRALAPSAVRSVLLNEETLDCLCDLGETACETGVSVDEVGSDRDCAALSLL